ncbi:MAG: hypothetical protein ACR2PL_05665 [Dehalococcoidia bacterium]
MLRLDEAGKLRLLRLAGYAEPEEAAQRPGTQAAVEGSPNGSRELGPAARRRRSWRLAGVATLILVAAALTVIIWHTNPAHSSEHALILPGGLWLSPENGLATGGPVHLAARAYPTNPGDPPIAFVSFTVSWEGRPGPWIIACKSPTPTQNDIYGCDWDPASVAAPPGPLHLSFDVYDGAKKAHVNFAPHGIRTITYDRFAPR